MATSHTTMPAAGDPGVPGAVAGIPHLLAPKTLALRRRFTAAATLARTIVLGAAGLLFYALLFAVLLRLLLYFRAAAGLGEVLAGKLLGLILLGFLSILVLSNVVTALSSFFLAHDLELIVAAPADGVRVYLARLTETITHSSWMVVLVLVPVLAAYGVVYHGGWLFAGVSVLALVSYIVIPGVLGAAITLVLVNVFPARRARDLLALAGLFGAAAVIVVIRLIRPEQLARPEGFRSLVDFIALLDTPRSAWLPSEWAAQALLAALPERAASAALAAAPALPAAGAIAGSWWTRVLATAFPAGVPDLFPLLLLVSTAAAMLVLGAWLHERLYREGFSRAQEGAELRSADAPRRPRLERVLARAGLDPRARALVAKDVRSFFRDTTQWSQLVLLAVLVAVYVYNVKVLPLYTGEKVGFFLVNVIAFLNLGLAGFVLAAVAARFLFPAVSLEGRTLWLLRSSPIELRRLLWTKFWVGLTPLLLLALALTAATNWVLNVGPFMMVLSLASIAVITFSVAALALGFGALFPQFDTDNAAEISTGFGGFLFMMVTTGYLGLVISAEAWPVYALLRARLSGHAAPASVAFAVVGGLGFALLVSAGAVLVPLRLAVRRVGEME